MFIKVENLDGDENRAVSMNQSTESNSQIKDLQDQVVSM